MVIETILFLKMNLLVWPILIMSI